MAYHRPSIEHKIKEASQIKKGLAAKTLVPKLKDEPLADPQVIQIPVEWDDPEYTLNTYKDLDANDKYFQRKSEEENNKLQDHIEKYQNPFPIEVFPTSIQAYIKDLEQCTNAAVEYTSAGILTVIAGAIGNKFHVQLKSGMTGKSTQIDPLPPNETDPRRPFQIDPLIPAQTDPLNN